MNAPAPDPWGILAALLELRAEVAALRQERQQPAAPKSIAELQPLTAILGGTAARCRQIEVRHPELVKLAISVGSRRHYRPADVLGFFGGKKGRGAGRPSGPRKLRGIDGGAR